MYDFEDKKIMGELGSLPTEPLIYNKEYIPFSLLFNLNHNNNISIKKYYENFKRDINYKKTNGVQLLEKKLKLWIDDIPVLFVTYRNWDRHMLSKFYEIVTGDSLYFNRTRFRSAKNYTRGYYSLFDEKLTEGYFVLMVKKEYIKYVKLSILLEEPILEDCFEFWYDSVLIDKAENYRIKKVAKKVLKDLESIDVPCIDKSNIMDLLQPVIEFKAPTIKKQKELISKFVENFQEHEYPKPLPIDIPDIHKFNIVPF